MYLAIIVLPLLGSIVSGFFGRKVGVSGAQILSTLSVITTTIFAIIAFFEVAINNISVQITTFRWLDIESINVFWAFNFDALTVSMLIPVLIISSLVHIYSVGYMSHDPHIQRFFSYLSLFTFMMIILVTGNNFLLMFVGWEGVGVCSYLLVSFWFTRIAANQSSMSAFLTNRVGDCFLTIGMFIILMTFGNLDYATVFSLAPFVSEDIITIIGICLLIGAMAKSSQIGLHVWLPLAMEGPTPVSALIHAATMVTAGVYLLMRASPLIEYSSTVLITALWIGSVTTVFSSLIGLFQQDIKKVIAYSTMSQLGMMVIAVGLSSYNLALFHLVNHAFYKGLLFLAAGAVIHAIADNQDFRKYGGLIVFLPLSYTVMLIASLSLVAFPFMTGFYSKDFILESSFGQFTYSGITVYFTALIGAMFTTLYSVKVLYLTFLANASASVVNYNKVHEGNIFMSLPLVVLAIFSILFGFLTKDIFIGLGTGIFSDNSIFIHPLHENVLSSEFAVPHTFKLLPFFITMFLIIMFTTIFDIFPKMLLYLKFSRLGYNVYSFLSLRFLIEFLYNRFIAYFILKVGGKTTKILDKGSIEMIGPYGLEKALITISRNLSKLDTGVVTTYALYILIGFILYLSIPYIYFKNQDILILTLSCALLYAIDLNEGDVLDKVRKEPNIMPKPQILVNSNIFRNILSELRKRFTIYNIVSGILTVILSALIKTFIFAMMNSVYLLLFVATIILNYLLLAEFIDWMVNWVIRNADPKFFTFNLLQNSVLPADYVNRVNRADKSALDEINRHKIRAQQARHKIFVDSQNAKAPNYTPMTNPSLDDVKRERTEANAFIKAAKSAILNANRSTIEFLPQQFSMEHFRRMVDPYIQENNQLKRDLAFNKDRLRYFEMHGVDPADPDRIPEPSFWANLYSENQALKATIVSNRDRIEDQRLLEERIVGSNAKELAVQWAYRVKALEIFNIREKDDHLIKFFMEEKGREIRFLRDMNLYLSQHNQP